MKVRRPLFWAYRQRRIELRAEGAEVDALYRAYLQRFGPDDEATLYAREAAANRRPYLVERLDPDEAGRVAEALAAHGMVSPARQLALFSIEPELEDLEEEAAAACQKMEELRDRAWRVFGAVQWPRRSDAL